MEAEKKKIQSCFAEQISSIRYELQGYEGIAGKAYFDCIRQFLPEEIKFERRQREAGDIYNCSLNYLYGILYAKIKRICFKSRLDPYIGIMHTDVYNKPTFVFDLIEAQGKRNSIQVLNCF